MTPTYRNRLPRIAAAVRRTEQHDETAGRNLRISYNEFCGRSGPTALSERVTSTTWTHVIRPNGPVVCVVAEASSGPSRLYATGSPQQSPYRLRGTLDSGGGRLMGDTCSQESLKTAAVLGR